MLRKGRLGSAFDADAASYTSSLDFDKTIAGYDVLGDMAHAIMLHESKIIKKAEAKKIVKGLLKIYTKKLYSCSPMSKEISALLSLYGLEERCSPYRLYFLGRKCWHHRE